MKIIDISKWGDFVVGSMFDIHPTANYDMTNSVLYNGGENPVIVNSKYNNGVGGYTTKETTEKGNMITFSDTVDANTIFYQPNPFVGYPHVQGLYPIGQYQYCWNKTRLMFFATVFRKMALTKGYDYGHKFRRDAAKKFIIKLPIDENGDPDWNYMDSFISKKLLEAEQKINDLMQ